MSSASASIPKWPRGEGNHIFRYILPRLFNPSLVLSMEPQGELLGVCWGGRPFAKPSTILITAPNGAPPAPGPYQPCRGALCK